MSEFMSEPRVGYRVVKSYRAGEARARRCYVGLSAAEEARLVSLLRAADGAENYAWDYLTERGE